jgi:hypothetical protein
VQLLESRELGFTSKTQFLTKESNHYDKIHSTYHAHLKISSNLAQNLSFQYQLKPLFLIVLDGLQLPCLNGRAQPGLSMWRRTIYAVHGPPRGFHPLAM